MILRRLAAAITEQNWFTVVLEVLIVVVGIFIGLQVDDWDQGRGDRALETRYLERLHSDLTGDLARFNRGDDLADIRMRAVNVIQQGIEDMASVTANPDLFIVSVRKVAWSSYQSITPNAYAELIGTGRMTLIRDESLRESLANYYRRIASWERILKRQDPDMAYVNATVGLLSKERLAAIQDTANKEGPGRIGASADEAIEIAGKLAGMPEATRWLPAIHNQHYLIKIVIAEHRARALLVIADIEALLPTGGAL